MIETGDERQRSSGCQLTWTCPCTAEEPRVSSYSGDTELFLNPLGPTVIWMVCLFFGSHHTMNNTSFVHAVPSFVEMLSESFCVCMTLDICRLWVGPLPPRSVRQSSIDWDGMTAMVYHIATRMPSEAKCGKNIAASTCFYCCHCNFLTEIDLQGQVSLIWILAFGVLPISPICKTVEQLLDLFSKLCCALCWQSRFVSANQSQLIPLEQGKSKWIVGNAQSVNWEPRSEPGDSQLCTPTVRAGVFN